MTETVWPILVGVVIALSVPAFKFGTQAIGRAVVAEIGDSLQLRWEQSIETAIAPIRAELTLNGGDSMKDRVAGLDVRMAALESRMAELCQKEIA